MSYTGVQALVSYAKSFEFEIESCLNPDDVEKWDLNVLPSIRIEIENLIAYGILNQPSIHTNFKCVCKIVFDELTTHLCDIVKKKHIDRGEYHFQNGDILYFPETEPSEVLILNRIGYFLKTK